MAETNLQNYRGFVISYDAKPIPIRDFDWTAHDERADPPVTVCNASNLEAVKREIDAHLEDQQRSLLQQMAHGYRYQANRHRQMAEIKRSAGSIECALDLEAEAESCMEKVAALTWAANRP